MLSQVAGLKISFALARISPLIDGERKKIPESCHWLYAEETQATVWPVLLASFNRKEACSSINSAKTIRWYFKIPSVTGNLLETKIHKKKLSKTNIINTTKKQERSNVKLQHLDKA